jgi:hypothetical protein
VTEDSDALQNALLAAVPAGTPAGDALRRYLESYEAFARVMATIKASPNYALTAPQLEAWRESLREIRRARSMMAEYAVDIGREEVLVDMPPVSVRVRCPATRELVGPEIRVQLEQIESSVSYNVSVGCGSCGVQHVLCDETAVIVPSPGMTV